MTISSENNTAMIWFMLIAGDSRSEPMNLTTSTAEIGRVASKMARVAVSGGSRHCSTTLDTIGRGRCPVLLEIISLLVCCWIDVFGRSAAHRGSMQQVKTECSAVELVSQPANPTSYRIPPKNQKPSANPLSRFINEGEYLVGEAIWRGERSSVSVAVEGDDVGVRKRVIDRFGRRPIPLRALATGQE